MFKQLDVKAVSRVNIQCKQGRKLDQFSVQLNTIDIPRILVVPRGEAKSGFKAFSLELGTLKYPAVSNELWIQHLRTNQLEVLVLGRGGIEEARLEDYIVSGLVDFDDISYLCLLKSLRAT